MEKSINCYIITVSDTRRATTDKSGQLIAEYIQTAGHDIINQVIVPDEAHEIEQAINNATQHPQTQIILITGGTGIAQRDITIEVLENGFEKVIPGFGEIFRMLSYTEDVGSPAIMSRATAGTINNKAIFAMPGSTGAVKLAMTKLILPELTHIVAELKK